MIIKVNETTNGITVASVNQEKNTFRMYDIEFTLVLSEDYSNETVCPCKIYDITAPDWDYPLGQVCHDLDDGKHQREAFEAFHNGIGEGLSRTGANIYQAAARMISHII